jgi:RHS repeat-associated protein
MLLDGGVWRSVHTDELGTPRVISTSDTAATVLWRARYESFGQAAINADVDGNGQSIEFNLRLPGQYYDAESGLHYNNQRSYDPATGRYIQTDPYGQYDHTNRYQYALNDPTGYTDPTGEFANVLVCTAACVAWESVTDPCFSPGKAAISCALDCLNPRKFLKLLRMADRLRKRTDGHHQITQEALKKLKERNRKGAYEAAKGRRGEPNIDEISRAEHKHRHRNQERYGPGGWQNHRVDKLIRDAGGYRNVTPAQIRRIREQVRREGRGGFL